MSKIKFTAVKVASFECEPGKKLSFFWDSIALGLGIRVSDKGTKNYIFQAKLKGEVIRITIGSTSAWSLSAAQSEARRLSVILDNGQDPRQVKADAIAEEQEQRAAKQAEIAALEAKNSRESVTIGNVWPIYIEERKPHWSARHTEDHVRMMHKGGEKRKRSAELTKPGPLADLANVRLVDLTPERVEAWAKLEATTRATRARLGLRHLKAFLFWCAAHPDYREIVGSNPAKSKKARESLGKAKPKNDVLQREQLSAWFDAVRKIGNPIISAYLQALLMTGARREEMMNLRWADLDFRWASMTISDKIEDNRIIPLTPYVGKLLAALPRTNEWVFSSEAAEEGRLTEPRIAHNKALAVAGLPHLTIHGLRRSFASLCEWVEMPSGIAAQIQGHAPQGVREQNYIRRPLDLLRMWHIKIEAWMLEQAGIEFTTVSQGPKLVAA